MAITNLKVSNFKSFKDLDLNLGRFNVLVGANASGKSNFVEIFRFLKTVEKENLDDAVSLHGGPTSIANVKLGTSEPLRMRMTSDQQIAWGGAWSRIHVWETTYDFSLQFDPQNGPTVTEDHFTQKLRTRIGDETLEMILDNLSSKETQELKISPPDVLERIERERASSEDMWLRQAWLPYVQVSALAAQAFNTRTLLVQHRGIFGSTGPSESLCGRIGVYDIDPHVVKRPHPTAGRSQLQENGENLALVLKQILADPEKKRKFHNLLQYILPFAVEVGTEQYLGDSLLLKLREEYYGDSLLANLRSDGTVDVVALITALFFEDKDVVIIEEPERSIHPHLISGLMRLMEDAARNKQIIITTHSPEVVKHPGVENLLLLARDKEGFSTVSRPADKQVVKVFLENNLGLDDVFVQELWGP